MEAQCSAEATVRAGDGSTRHVTERTRGHPTLRAGRRGDAGVTRRGFRRGMPDPIDDFAVSLFAGALQDVHLVATLDDLKGAGRWAWRARRRWPRHPPVARTRNASRTPSS